jgi:hypothetical protein
MQTLLGMFLIIFTIYSVKREFFQLEPAIYILTFQVIAIFSSFLGTKKSFLIRGGGLPPIYTSPEMFQVTEKLFMQASIAIFFACISVNLFQNNRVSNLKKKTSEFNSQILSKFSNYYLFFIYAILIYYLLSVGRPLVQRNTYLFNLGGSIEGNIHYYLPIFSIISVYLAVNNDSYIQKVFLCGFSWVCILESFSSASRGITVQIAVITCILSIKRYNWYRRVGVIVTGTFITVWLTSIVLKLRTFTLHGFAPYLKGLFSNSQNFSIDINEFMGNFLSIIPTTYLGVQITPPHNMLMVQISPFTGRSNGWYEMAGALMVNSATPSGAIAQIGSLGNNSAFLTWFFLGIFITIVSRSYKAMSIFPQQRIISYVLNFGAMIQMLQYSLRIGMRFLYLNLIILLSIKIYAIVMIKNKS